LAAMPISLNSRLKLPEECGFSFSVRMINSSSVTILFIMAMYLISRRKYNKSTKKKKNKVRY
jgi:hypothetical protein